MARKIRRVPGHEHHRRRVEPLHEQTALIVDRRRKRAVDASSAAFGKPAFRRFGQCADDFDVVDCVQRSELRARSANGLDVRLINLRGDAADPSSIASRQKLLSVDAFEMRIETMRIIRPTLHVERRRKALRAGV